MDVWYKLDVVVKTQNKGEILTEDHKSLGNIQHVDTASLLLRWPGIQSERCFALSSPVHTQHATWNTLDVTSNKRV